MKYEIFTLCDLSVKGEGNLHVIVLNKRTGNVLRFPKENSDNETTPDGILQLNLTKVYKLEVTFKKYTVIPKFLGKENLPKTRVCRIPSQLIKQIAFHLDNNRSEIRKHKSIVTKTSYIEVQPDLTKFPLEYNLFSSGSTFCVELKPKFGILFLPRCNTKVDCRNETARFCLSQNLNSPSDRTHYCPCDLFSGDVARMKRAIKELIKHPKEKLRIFQDGQMINPLNENCLQKVMQQLLNQDLSESSSVDHFCDLIIESLTYDLSYKYQQLRLPYKVSTNCQGHPWSRIISDNSSTNSFRAYEGSVLGRVIRSSCLVDNSIDEVKEKYELLKRFLIRHDIGKLFQSSLFWLDGKHQEKKEDIFDLWGEHLIPLDLPAEIKNIVRILKKYIICLTVRDCSVMMKFRRTSLDDVDNLKLKDTNFVITLNDNHKILTRINLIDLSFKPLSKIKHNFELERKLVKSNE